jgi:hypothetical protein
VGGKKTFLSWFRYLIRLNGKKTSKKSFLVSFQQFCKKNHGCPTPSGLSKKIGEKKADAFVHHF